MKNIYKNYIVVKLVFLEKYFSLLEQKVIKMSVLDSFKDTPIKEIIFSMSFSRQKTFDEVEEFTKRKEVQDKFFSKNSFEAVLDTNNGEEHILSKGVILSNGPKVIQAKQAFFAFHKIHGYEEYNSLYKEYIELWNLFNDGGTSNEIIHASLRYINFIKFEKKETIRDLVNVFTAHPYEDSTKTVNSLSQLTFVDNNCPAIGVTIVSSIGMNKEKEKGVVLDIDLSWRESFIGEQKIKEVFDEMRKVKNDLFLKSITKKAIQKYI